MEEVSQETAHGDAWAARIRAEHERLGADCPCGNGVRAMEDETGRDQARMAAGITWITPESVESLREELTLARGIIEELEAERDEAIRDRIRVAEQRNFAQEARSKDDEHYRRSIATLRANAQEQRKEIERLRGQLRSGGFVPGETVYVKRIERLVDDNTKLRKRLAGLLEILHRQDSFIESLYRHDPDKRPREYTEAEIREHRGSWE